MTPDVLNAVFRTDLTAFVERTFMELHHGKRLRSNYHISAIAAALERARHKPGARLVINMPPRMLKSITTSIAFVAFLIGHNPHTKVILVTYTEPLASKLISDLKVILRSPFFRSAFPAVRLTSQRQLELGTDCGGGCRATTIGGSITGFGADWIILDDPNSGQDALSAVGRQAAINYYKSVLLSRLDDPAEGRIVVVQQRLHEDDVSGYVLAQGEWEQLKLQAIATHPQTIPMAGGGNWQVQDGELLQPERLSRFLLDQRRQEMGSANFAAQYQQEPVSAEGNMIKLEWLRYYDRAPARADLNVVQSWDTATKTDPAHDYSVCTTWLTGEGAHHLLDVWRGKVDYPNLKHKVLEQYAIHDASHILIEDNGSGRSLLQELARQNVPAIGRKSTDSKESRLAAASSFIEAGKMYLPREAHWLAEFERELLGFPGARHDDQVDSVSQYFAWIRERPGLASLKLSYLLDPPELTMESIAHHLIWRHN